MPATGAIDHMAGMQAQALPRSVQRAAVTAAQVRADRAVLC
jgi:hypothetical protein